MRERGKYLDYITRYEMTSLLRKGGSIEPELQRRIHALAIRSGAAGVGSGVVLREPRGEELRLRVVFDSSAWTGRDTTSRYRTDLLSRLLGWLWNGLRREFCAHKLRGWPDQCGRCGMTAQAITDHSWRRLPRGVFI